MKLQHIDLSEYSRIKQFSHNDLDGIGSAIMGYNVCELNMVEETFNYKLCTYKGIDSDIITYLEDHYDEYGNPLDDYAADFILITDIGITEKIADKLNVLYKAGIGLLLIDHHVQNKHLDDKYEWAHVIHDIDGEKTSATSLMFEMLINTHRKSNGVFTTSFKELVRSYDTWDWKKNNDLEALDLNTYFYFVGEDKFFERFKGVNVNAQFTKYEREVIEQLNYKKEKYIQKALCRVERHELFGYTVAVVYAEEHISELGNIICERDNEIDFAVIINMASELISLRSVKKDIHVGEISKEYLNGGGHPPAAGAQVPKVFTEIKKTMLEYFDTYGKDTSHETIEAN